jgi:hypothetical protein
MHFFFMLPAQQQTAGASRHPPDDLPPPLPCSFVAPESWLRNYRTRSLPSNGQRTKAHLTQPTHVLTLASPPSFITGTVPLPRRVELELAKRQKSEERREARAHWFDIMQQQQAQPHQLQRVQQ